CDRGAHRDRAAGGRRMSGLRIDVLSLFPKMFESPFAESIVGRARAAGQLQLTVQDIRDSATDRHHVVDDAPYGGGAGMVLKPEPLFRAVESLNDGPSGGPDRILLLTPQGMPFNQALARELA